MPSKIDNVRINANGPNKKLDRRFKLTDDDRQTIRDRYFNVHEAERPTMTSLANEYGVDRRLIQFILFPERAERHKELAKERRKDGRYYDKERERVYKQNHRDYKRELIKSGKLEVPS